MDDDLITLDEAYRELIRAKDLELAAQATSLKEVPCLRLSGTEWEKTREWKEHSAKILLNCAEQLRAAIRTGKLPLCGYPATGVDQIDIDQTDREVGELDFWKGTLSRDGRLIFTHVRCSRADVRRLVIPPAPVPSSKGGRPSDKGLIVNEARRRLDEGQGADSLRAFAQRLHEWLDKKPEARRAAKTGRVMLPNTIEGHVKDMWNAHREKT
jgi:hypothetical protein